MTIRLTYFLVCLTLGLYLSAQAQTPTTPSETADSNIQDSTTDSSEVESATIDVSILIIEQFIAQNTNQSRKKALYYSQELISKRSLSADDTEKLATVISKLAGQGINNRLIDSSRNDYDDTLVRAEGAKILGDLGGTNAQSTLLYIVSEDLSPTVVAEAVVALSLIPVGDFKADVTYAIGELLRTNRALNRDPNLSTAAIKALENIANQDIALLNSDDMIYELTYIISPESGYVQDVRLRALNLLDKVFGS